MQAAYGRDNTKQTKVLHFHCMAEITQSNQKCLFSLWYCQNKKEKNAWMVKGCKKFIRHDLKERELKTTTATTKQRIKNVMSSMIIIMILKSQQQILRYSGRKILVKKGFFGLMWQVVLVLEYLFCQGR